MHDRASRTPIAHEYEQNGIMTLGYDTFSFEKWRKKGGYNYCNSCIKLKNFPVEDTSEKCLEWSLVEPALISIWTQRGWREGGMEHILVLGAIFPELQCRCVIVGTASSADLYGAGVCAPCLRGHDTERSLGLFNLADDRPCPNVRFLYVREI